jgi:hypothetical protein
MAHSSPEYMRKYMRDYRKNKTAEELARKIILAVRDFPEYQQLSDGGKRELDQKILALMVDFEARVDKLLIQKLEEAQIYSSVRFEQIKQRLMENSDLRKEVLLVVKNFESEKNLSEKPQVQEEQERH